MRVVVSQTTHQSLRRNPRNASKEHPANRVQGRFGGEQGALQQEEHDVREVGGGERALADAEAQVALVRPEWVTTIIHCLRHNRDSAPICVQVDRGVPDELRCSPGGGSVGGGGGASSLDCPCGGRFDTSDLSQRVADAMRRRLNEWKSRGAVVIEV
jgi:hypothetical protein